MNSLHVSDHHISKFQLSYGQERLEQTTGLKAQLEQNGKTILLTLPQGPVVKKSFLASRKEHSIAQEYPTLSDEWFKVTVFFKELGTVLVKVQET